MGKLCHFEIPSKDFERSTKFYEALFGWKVDILPGMDYALINIEDGVGGGFNKEIEPMTDFGCGLYFEVEDIPGTMKKAVELGGAEVTPKTGVGGGDFGYYSVFKDPDGNLIGLWSKA